MFFQILHLPAIIWQNNVLKLNMPPIIISYLPFCLNIYLYMGNRNYTGFEKKHNQ